MCFGLEQEQRGGSAVLDNPTVQGVDATFRRQDRGNEPQKATGGEPWDRNDPGSLFVGR